MQQNDNYYSNMILLPRLIPDFGIARQVYGHLYKDMVISQFNCCQTLDISWTQHICEYKCQAVQHPMHV